ncbi:helix-turn-helix domain-containing protein [Edaphobacter modestus]|nr:helix-turn-helix transcriptional regulator [Edaphobacter modestus]
MVDRKKPLNRPDADPIQIYRGCNSRVASAVNMFSRQWARYSVRSRRYPIYVLLADIVDGAWRDYIATLPVAYLGRVLCEGQLLSIIAERNGFPFFDDLFACVVNSTEGDRKLNDWIRSRDGVLPPVGEFNLEQIHHEFRATVSTLRELASRCEGKEPKKIRVGRLNARRLKPYCELCGEATELGMILKGATWPLQDPNKKASLSARYCSSHRPKHHDGTWNPSYQRARRSKEKFEWEIFKIKHHTSNVPDISLAKGKGIGDPFLWNLAHQLDIVLFESDRIRNVARQLVDARISIRKRQAIMLLTAGISQSEIARRLGVSRQAISKIASSEPFQRISMMYRFGN